MTFSETIVNEVDRKYTELLSGNIECMTDTLEISSCAQYEEKNRVCHQRLELEEADIQIALRRIKKNREAAQKRAEEAKAKEAQKTQEQEPEFQEVVLNPPEEEKSSCSPWFFALAVAIIAWFIAPGFVKTVLTIVVVIAIVAIVIWVVKRYYRK